MDVPRAIGHIRELLGQLPPNDAERPELENILIVLVCYRQHDTWVDGGIGQTTSDDGGIW